MYTAPPEIDDDTEIRPGYKSLERTYTFRATRILLCAEQSQSFEALTKHIRLSLRRTETVYRLNVAESCKIMHREALAHYRKMHYCHQADR
jgi:hypothetical protein